MLISYHWDLKPQLPQLFYINEKERSLQAAMETHCWRAVKCHFLAKTFARLERCRDKPHKNPTGQGNKPLASVGVSEHGEAGMPNGPAHPTACPLPSRGEDERIPLPSIQGCGGGGRLDTAVGERFCQTLFGNKKCLGMKHLINKIHRNLSV